MVRSNCVDVVVSWYKRKVLDVAKECMISAKVVGVCNFGCICEASVEIVMARTVVEPWDQIGNGCKHSNFVV